AWKIATAGPQSSGGSGRGVGFFGAAAFQWVNPKSWLVCASAAATFLASGESAFGQALLLGAVFVTVAIPSCLPWLAFGAVLQRVLHSARAVRIFNGAMGLLLAASVVFVVR